ncbi:hypothetical protein SODALDRAFT_377074 [Sodiomyces alkalinus F11]|uniref:Uncharacterized protein n=1 Tax=Sodiomyces alkalinus (strain CBS 110278 / VKM F-3762 / F11) TaxID=1314773 RepID=A0A3N2Q3V8_SODAK|nr:hypothetical protein SODALDRAFT_377074 [Sodiomyces alkalinus F11]ROT41397.1 hypothetical protein SODALDRAFT_377074 [Sodiomyces alkalinus F11]
MCPTSPGRVLLMGSVSMTWHVLNSTIMRDPDAPSARRGLTTDKCASPNQGKNFKMIMGCCSSSGAVIVAQLEA